MAAEKFGLAGRLTDVAYLFLRVVVGIIMVAHGWQKIVNYSATADGFAGLGLPFPKAAVALAIAGEFGGGLGLILGALTPIAALGVAATMAVAVFWVHLPNGLMAGNNGFEYPLTLLAAALFIAANGSGPWGLDRVLCRSTSKCRADDRHEHQE